MFAILMENNNSLFQGIQAINMPIDQNSKIFQGNPGGQASYIVVLGAGWMEGHVMCSNAFCSSVY